MDNDHKWSHFTQYIADFGYDKAMNLLGLDAHEQQQPHLHHTQAIDHGSPDLSWGTGFNHCGGNGDGF